MSSWEHREADPEMADRIRVEFQGIMSHLGQEAPSEDTPIEPHVTADDRLHFWTAGAGYALAGDCAIRYVLVGETERADHFKDGERVSSIVVPPTPHNN